MKRKFKPRKKANTSHIAHQVGVSGVGPHRSKKQYKRRPKHVKKAR